MKVLTPTVDKQVTQRLRRSQRGLDRRAGAAVEHGLRDLLAKKRPEILEILRVTAAAKRARVAMTRTRRVLVNSVNGPTTQTKPIDLTDLDDALILTSTVTQEADGLATMLAGVQVEKLKAVHRKAVTAVRSGLGQGLRERRPEEDLCCLARLTVALGAVRDPNFFWGEH